MKTKLLTLALVAALAACNQTTANNMAGNQSAGLATPPERPATTTQQAQPAAMPEGLDCVRNRLSPEERRDAAAVAMEQGSREDPRLQPLLAATEACGEELSWSPEKRRLAGIFSVSAAGAAGLREMLAGRGVRLEELDSAIIGDRELMAAAEANELGSSAVGQAFAMRHSALIERIAGNAMDQELGTRIGNYIAFRAMAEAAAVQFGRAS